MEIYHDSTDQRLPIVVRRLRAGRRCPRRPELQNEGDRRQRGRPRQKYKGKVVLFVNVASQCGATDQYAGLQKLYAGHEKDGLVIIGVPANEFGQQEPGSNEEIAKFCQKNYKVTFPMLAKVVVKGDGICPLYGYLTSKGSGFGGDIGWNFEKFLIGRDGKVAARFKTDVEPDADEFVKAIKAQLDKK